MKWSYISWELQAIAYTPFLSISPFSFEGCTQERIPISTSIVKVWFCKSVKEQPSRQIARIVALPLCHLSKILKILIEPYSFVTVDFFAIWLNIFCCFSLTSSNDRYIGYICNLARIKYIVLSLITPHPLLLTFLLRLFRL